MANNFIGLCMLVTLNTPPGAQVKGTVSGIQPGKSLTLSNVFYTSTGKFLPECTLRASEIQELTEVVPEDVAPARTTPHQTSTSMEIKPFEDPAILSVGRRPIPNDRSPMNTLESNSSWEQVVAPETISKHKFNDDKAISSLITRTTSLSLVDSSKENILHIKQSSEDGNDLSQSSKMVLKSKKRTQRRKSRKTEGDVDKDAVVDPANTISKSKGWRQTPLLEPNPTFQPFSNLNRKGKGKHREEEGWGTEDATDVQELGDFDFEGGLAKFDKSTLFNQLQAADGTAEEDRLVSFNISSRARSGKFNKKNLLHSENVIDDPKPIGNNLKMKSETWIDTHQDVDEDREISLNDTENSRLIRHMETKLNSNRRPLDLRPSSRKGITNCSLPPSRSYSVSRSANNPAFYVSSSGRRCESVSPLQMFNLENIATNELGLSEEIITENSGRSIAEVAFSALSKSGNTLARGNSPLNATIVVLVGNNKSGLRAVAAARHLRNHCFNVILCVLGLDQESELLASLRSQIRIFRNLGGKVMSKEEFFEFSRKIDSPVDLIIDGLIGLAISFEDLRLGDQSTIYELIEWANRSKAAVLAIDIPTGIDPTNGEISIIDGRKIYLCPNFVVALGAPKRGLLEAMILGNGIGVVEDCHSRLGNSGSSHKWQLFVADIGLGEVIWKKAGSKIRRGIEFEQNWVLKLNFKGFEA